jgi:hypothetical protein
MNPLQTSARFAAYLWFLKQEVNCGKSRKEAHAFARRNWEQFLPVADEGFGRLLQVIAAPRKVKTATA